MKNVVKILAQLGFEDNVSRKDASHCVASHFLVCQMLLSYSGMQRPSLSTTWKKHVALKPLKPVPVGCTSMMIPLVFIFWGRNFTF